MKVKVLDLAVVDENKNVEMVEESDLFSYFDYDENIEDMLNKIKNGEDIYKKGDWSNYIANMNKGNLDGYTFEEDEIDKEVFVLEDGGELFRLKDGTYMNVCWRGSLCRVWPQTDKRSIKYMDKKLKK